MHGVIFHPNGIKNELYNEVEKVDECHTPHDETASASENHMQMPTGLDMFEEPEEATKPVIHFDKYRLPKSYMPEAIIARGVAGLYTSLI